MPKLCHLAEAPSLSSLECNTKKHAFCYSIPISIKTDISSKLKPPGETKSLGRDEAISLCVALCVSMLICVPVFCQMPQYMQSMLDGRRWWPECGCRQMLHSVCMCARLFDIMFLKGIMSQSLSACKSLCACPWASLPILFFPWIKRNVIICSHQWEINAIMFGVFALLLPLMHNLQSHKRH